MPRPCVRKWRPCSLPWGCGWHPRRPASSTSTRASRSLALTSAGCASEGPASTTSTPSRPRRLFSRSRTRCGPRRTGQPATRTWASYSADVNRSLAGWANHFRHGVSKATFSVVDSFTWNRLMRWTRAKYAGKTGLSMKELRRRFCDQGWRFAHNGVVLTGAASVAGDPLPLPRQHHPDPVDPETGSPTPAADQRARHVERPMRGDVHVGCGGRAGETHRERSRQGAPVRPETIAGNHPAAPGPRPRRRPPPALGTAPQTPRRLAPPAASAAILIA